MCAVRRRPRLAVDRHTAPVRTDPQVLLRGIAKLLTVTLAAGIAGALIGVGLAAVTAGDDTSAPAPSPATSAAATSTTATAATSTTATTSGSATSTTSGAPSAAAQAADGALVPRVLVMSADLVAPAGVPSRVVTQVRVTNRADGPLELTPPAMVVDGSEVTLSADAAAGADARPLLGTLPAGQSATGVLRFTITEALATELRETPRARLRIADRVVNLRIAT